MAKRYPLPKRFNAAMSEAAYARLRALNGEYGLGNNYLLTVLLENIDAIDRDGRMDAVFRAFIEDYGAPAKGRGAGDGQP